MANTVISSVLTTTAHAEQEVVGVWEHLVLLYHRVPLAVRWVLWGAVFYALGKYGHFSRFI